jgi:hypothetical protein
MAAHLICETCLRLWVEHGEATAKMRAITRDQSLMLDATEIWKALAQLIRVHEATADTLTYTATTNHAADRAKATAA